MKIARSSPIRFLCLGLAVLLVGHLAGRDAPSLAQNRDTVTVEAEPVTVTTLTSTIEAIGTLRSDESVIVRPEIDGRISGIHFDEGQPVEEGTLLISIDDSLIAAELAEAEARLKLSEQNAERARELARKGSGTQRALDEAVATLRVDRARVELVRARLEKTRIRAPFGGRLGLRHVSIGDYVKAGDDLVNLEAIDTLKVDFRVPEIFLSRVAEGQEIELTVDAFPGRTFTGNVYAIDPLIDAQGRSIVIRARVKNDDLVLRPGLFARVTLIAARKENAILVPEAALAPENNRQFVFRIVDGTARKVAVSTGQRRNAMVEITSGLSPGDVIVTAGHLKIRDGSAVEIAKPPVAAAES